MSDKSILQRYAVRPSEAGSGNGSADADGTEDLGAFGWLRGIRDRAVMLELRRKDGNILALAYGYMDRAEFDPSEGITLSVAGQKIQIKGRNLNSATRPMVRLFEGITRHRVPWIREADNEESLTTDNHATVIDAIAW